MSEFNKSIKSLKSLDEESKRYFIDCVDRIIGTDKNIDPMEIAAKEKIKKIIGIE
ncbi:MAG: hypothetical protein KDK54_22955 [Leptospiraceae bacterium]|nr:hypothetical protein [Leptospiraceae bacterium]